MKIELNRNAVPESLREDVAEIARKACFPPAEVEWVDTSTRDMVVQSMPVPQGWTATTRSLTPGEPDPPQSPPGLGIVQGLEEDIQRFLSEKLG